MTTPNRDAAALVDELHAAGELPAACRAAFLAVPREKFIPDRVWIPDGDTKRHVPVDRGADPDAWLAAVYSDCAIVTQYDDGDTWWPNVGERPTCAASQPSTVAGMLVELSPQSGEHISEIGLGTGYNAALVAHMVGPHGSVSSVDIDRAVVEVARANLVAAGVSNVAAGRADATRRLAAGPVDRLIATAGVKLGRLPCSWVKQTRPGGVIVAPMRADLASGPLVRFVVDEDGTATGRATTRLQVGFMELRSQRFTGAMAGLRWDDPAADVSYTEVVPWTMLGEPDSRWAVAVALPSTVYDLWEKTSERRGVAWLRDPSSRSWATVSVDAEDRFVVRQVGPRRLWDAAEAAYRWWRKRGAPPLHEWVWRVGSREQSVTLSGSG